MTEEPSRVALPTPFRVISNTPKRLRWLLLLSLVLHLVLTPFAGWLGLASVLFWPEQGPEILPEEELTSIPIELFDAPKEQESKRATDPELPPLPEQDPVGFIEEVIPEPVLPVVPEPPKPEKTAAPASSPAPINSPEPTSPPPPSAAPTVDKPQTADGGAPRDAEPEDEKPDEKKPRRAIDDPIALAGKPGELVEKQAYVSIAIYTDRIRDHAVGKRIERLLPSLPQWQDFFPDGHLNPVRDFDRLMVMGPSFANSANVLAALHYNASPKVVHATIDQLVERNGEWLKDTKVPAARAFADRAERIFVMPRDGLVLVVPPKLKQAALGLKEGIPPPAGPEAMVAYLATPHRPLARYNIQIPKSVKDARVRLTPLSAGRVKLEVEAHDESPEQAKATARQVSQAINSLADLSQGVSSLLELAGFGRTVALPRFELQAKGSDIWGEQTLTWEQVDFLLGQFERQALMWSQASQGKVARPEGAERPGSATTGSPKTKTKQKPRKSDTKKASPRFTPAAPRSGSNPHSSTTRE